MPAKKKRGCQTGRQKCDIVILCGTVCIDIMPLPVEDIIARAPKMFAMSAVPILTIWGLTAYGREKTADEEREEKEERARRARMLKELCDVLAASKFDVTNTDKENQIEWEDILRRCRELALMDGEAPERGSFSSSSHK